MLKKSENCDIIFEAGEDLYSQTKAQLLVLQCSSVKFPIAKPRRFQSYCYEFCGVIGLSFKTLRFLSLGRDMSPDLAISTSCLVKVYHTSDFNMSVSNPLKSSLLGLFRGGNYSDITLRINGKLDLNAHKCILASRSAKFEGMFSCGFSESKNSLVEIECKNTELFRLLMIWIYCGEIKFPSELSEVFDLLLLADEYMMSDLKEKCEEDIKVNIDESNALKILILCERNPIVSNELLDKCKSLFIDEFDKILKINPELEKEIISIPGLMTKLFTHIHAKKNSKKRKVTFVIEEHSE